MKRPLTIGELFAIMAVLCIPALGWGFSFSMKVQANETNIENMQQVNIELLNEIKGQSVILTDIRIGIAGEKKEEKPKNNINTRGEKKHPKFIID